MGGLVVLVTGAGGYIGRSVVASLLGRGYMVRALFRQQRNSPDSRNLQVVHGDLADGIPEGAFRDVYAVIHAAGSMSGDAERCARDTRQATETLVRQMRHHAPGARLILVSSISVLDYATAEPDGQIDDATPLEATPAERDTYSRSKIEQERIVRESGLQFIALRLGAVWGPGRLFNAHLGIALGPMLLLMDSDGQIPLAHIDHCSEALVRSVENTAALGRTMLIVDADLPTRREYVAALRRSGWPKLVVRIPWKVFDAASVLCRPIGRMPGLLTRRVLRTRIMPLFYSATAARELFPGLRSPEFEGAMHAALEDGSGYAAR